MCLFNHPNNIIFPSKYIKKLDQQKYNFHAVINPKVLKVVIEKDRVLFINSKNSKHTHEHVRQYEIELHRDLCIQSRSHYLSSANDDFGHTKKK